MTIINILNIISIITSIIQIIVSVLLVGSIIKERRYDKKKMRYDDKCRD